MTSSIPSAYRTPGGQFYRPFLDLAARPHLLIAGATGSGKSVLVNGIITTLLMQRSPSLCQFVMLDPKRVELVDFATLPHTIHYASEPDDMLRALSWTVDEMDRRFRVMQATRTKNYEGADMYIIIDELADLMTTQKNAVLPLLQRIAQVGRAAHVHLIACTQNVLAITIPTVLKCNFPVTVGLRTASRRQSMYLIDAPGCELLPDPITEHKSYAWIRDGANLHKEFIYRYTDNVLPSLINWWTTSACVA